MGNELVFLLGEFGVGVLLGGEVFCSLYLRGVRSSERCSLYLGGVRLYI